MTQVYSNPEREDSPRSLPDVEVFWMPQAECDEYNEINEAKEGDEFWYPGEGWYWWACFPGCLPDSIPFGPFDTEAEAIADARNFD